MKLGKLSESVLKRSVLKEIPFNRIDVTLSAGVSVDCGAIKIPKGHILVATTDPITCALTDIPTFAVHTVINDIAVMGAEPLGITITILLPEDAMESDLKKMMRSFNNICVSQNLQILGGHTETTSAVNRPIVSITGIGSVLEEELLDIHNIKPGQDIVMTKGIGIEGTAILARDWEKDLLKRFSPSFIKNCKDFINDISVREECSIAKTFDVTAMHDVSEGGIFGSLWEMAASAGVGVEAELKQILVKQETIELCELFDLNPYSIISGGTALIVTDRGDELVSLLQENEIAAAVIGKVIHGNDRVVINGEERRFLEPPRCDELQRLMQERGVYEKTNTGND